MPARAPDPELWRLGAWPRHQAAETPERKAAKRVARIPDLFAARGWRHPHEPRRKVAQRDPNTGDTTPSTELDIDRSNQPEEDATTPRGSTPDDRVTSPIEVDDLATLRGKVTTIHLGPDGLFGGGVRLGSPATGGPGPAGPARAGPRPAAPASVVFPGAGWGGGGEIRASLPADYEASASPDDMLTEYLPDFWDNLPLSWETAHENLSDGWSQDRVPGLFWEGGWGFMHRAMLFALQLLHLYAEEGRDPTTEGYARYHASDLRAKLEGGQFPVDVTNEQVVFTGAGGQYLWILPDGSVRVQATGIEYWAITLDKIQVPRAMRLQAAAADYLFWWAHRLHSASRESGPEGGRLWWVGLCCARAALAEINQMAAILLHEYIHLTSKSAFHCVDLLGVPYGCCEYQVSYSFQYGVMSILALPEPRAKDLGWDEWRPEEGNDNRFRYTFADRPAFAQKGGNQVDGSEAAQYASALWAILLDPLNPANVLAWIAVVTGADVEPSCGGFHITFTSTASFWDSNRDLFVTWLEPSECSGGTVMASFYEVIR